MSEKWRSISGWPYEVSDLGRVRRIGAAVPLVPKHHTNGYHRVVLCNAGQQKDEYVHRIVCAAFHGEPAFPNMEVDHRNSVRDDNRATNLQWLTVSQNRQKRNHARGEGSGVSKLTEQQVREINTLLPHEADEKIGHRYSVHRRTINDIRRRKTWSHINV